VLANTDIQVYKNTTLLTLTTNYTVTINANGTGSVTLVVAATGADTITIVGDRAIQRATDFVTGGDLFANTLNDEFDSLVIFAQQVDEKADRGLKAPVTDPTDVNMVLPVKASRKGKVLAFDSTTGDPVAGPALDAVTTVIDQSANINTVATNIASVNTVAGISANVTTVAGISGNVTTVAGISANVTSVAGNSSNINTVAGNNANVTAVGTISGNVTTVAGISANVTSVAGNSTNINAVASNATNINAVNANATNINTVAGVNANVTTVATNIASVNTAATNIAAIIDAPNQATAAANSAIAAAASAASGMYSAVQDKSANYTVVAGDAGDLIRVTTTSGAVTITLPTISTVEDGFKVAIVKWTGDANAVTVSRSSTNTINGATSATIGSQYSQTIFVADFETNQWFAASSGLGASNVAVDAFSGNGSTTAFTLSGDPGSENNTQVFVSGVYQEKDTYSVSGTTLTFSTAPPTGTSNIEVVWTAPLAIGTPSDGTVTTAKLASTTGSGAVVLATSPTITTPVINGFTGDTSVVNLGSGQVYKDASGNVGINTTSPNSKLYVRVATDANLRVTDSSGTLNLSAENNAGSAQVAMKFNGSQMMLNASGNLGIGVTPPAWDGSFRALDIGSVTSLWTIGSGNGTSYYTNNLYYNGSARIYKTTGGASEYTQGGSAHGFYVAASGTAGSSVSLTNVANIDANSLYTYVGVNPSNNGAVNARIFNSSSGSGTVTLYVGNASITTVSDSRLKENVVNTQRNALDLLSQLRVVDHTWNDPSDTCENNRNSRGTWMGLIAQEAQPIIPWLVNKPTADVDENGDPQYWHMDYGYSVPLLIKAIQEQQAQITAQAETINALTARVTALEGN
jgi:hypothetical protein